MIREKTIEIHNRAKDYLEQNSIYTSKEVCYGYTQKIIDLIIGECIEATKSAD